MLPFSNCWQSFLFFRDYLLIFNNPLLVSGADSPQDLCELRDEKSNLGKALIFAILIVKMILGIDPGVASTGWAVLDKDKLIASGCIKTSKKDDFSCRLGQIYQEVAKICSRWSVVDLAIEEIFFAKNAKTAIKVAQVVGAIKTAAQNNGVQVFGYTPLQIKIAVVGYGRAEKRQVELMVEQMVVLKEKINSSHAVDALAAALTHQVIFKK